MMSIVKSAFLILATAGVCLFVAGVAGSSAQPAHRQPNGNSPTANFIFDDGNGPADAGTYPAGASFTFSINLSFTPGGNIANLDGLSYWFEQQSPLAPFYFAITNRNFTGSQFTSAQSPSLAYPQLLMPSNSQDLGALTPSGSVGAGTWFIASVTISIDPSAAPGTYILENTTSGFKTSVIADTNGHILAIPHTSYTVTVVPFAITSITLLDNLDILLQCQGVPNGVNRIEASPDMSPNSFQTIGSVTADSSGTFSFEDTTPGPPRFYRLAFP
jgi:hypothetical protein